MKGITPRQEEVLKFISRFVKENGFPPTVREIGENFKISLRAVQDHIAALQKKGYLSQSQKRARSISVLSDLEKNDEQLFTKVPILGNIFDKENILSEENFDGYLNLVEPFIKKEKSYFAVKIRGESMRDIGIIDGDLAILEKAAVASDGQIVVVFVDNAVMLRRYYKETDKVRLQPENAQFPAIFSENVEVLGILSSIIRQY